jgi:uncharacterized membrane protein
VKVDVLASSMVVLTGTLAGTLFTVESAIVPTLLSLPGDRWVQVHTGLDRRFDPLMPSINKVSLGICAALVVLAEGRAAKTAFALGGAGTVGVALVSELFNVRMNKHVVTWDPEALPSGWTALRARWAAANRVRTAFALGGFVSTVVGAALV